MAFIRAFPPKKLEIEKLKSKMVEGKAGNILFFYSELAGYFLACAETLHLTYGYDVHIVHWPVHPEAPFEFREYTGVHLHPKANFTSEQLWDLYTELAPKLVFCIGWMDTDYKKLAKRIKSKGIPVVAGLDNHWRGDLKQQLARWISPFYLKPFFDYLWVPGKPQYTFARKLGYADAQILQGFYAADLKAYYQAYERFQEEKLKKYPHKFLYVGRFVEVNGVENLVQAFDRLRGDMEHDWELKLVGAGALKSSLEGYENVQVHDFVQPEELPELVKDAGCFVMPSLHEPWGVVIHEFAGAGLPLLCTKHCGAASAFLSPDENGFFFQDTSVEAMIAGLKKIIMSSDQELQKMSLQSHELSQQISPESWARTIQSVLD